MSVKYAGSKAKAAASSYKSVHKNLSQKIFLNH